MPPSVRDQLRDTKSGSSSVDYYYFKEGVTQLRVLPTVTKDGDFFLRSNEHYVNRATPPCPRSAEDPYPCPICEKGERLYNLKGEKNVEAAKSLQPRNQFYFTAVIFSSPDEKTVKDGPFVVRCGIKIIRQLIDLDEDVAGGWGNMTDFEKGFDVKVSRKKTGKDVREVEYNVTPVRPLKTFEENLSDQGVSLKELVVPDLDAFVLSRFEDEKALEGILENVSAAPGFPGGPRSKPVELPQPTDTPAPPVEVGEEDTFDVEGDMTPPPTVED